MLKDQTSIIKEICHHAHQPLQYVYEQWAEPPFTFELNLNEMEDYNLTDIRKSETHMALFNKLIEIKGPVLYLFEIISKHDSHAVLKAFEDYKQSPDCKAIPALKTKLNHGSTILYVGKVKRHFWGRLIQHLGFYKVNRTQGLQLYYWAKPLGLQLRVHVYEFPQDMASLMPIVENGVAARLNPLLGKHK